MPFRAKPVHASPLFGGTCPAPGAIRTGQAITACTNRIAGAGPVAPAPLTNSPRRCSAGQCRASGKSPICRRKWPQQQLAGAPMFCRRPVSDVSGSTRSNGFRCRTGRCRRTSMGPPSCDDRRILKAVQAWHHLHLRLLSVPLQPVCTAPQGKRPQYSCGRLNAVVVPSGDALSLPRDQANHQRSVALEPSICQFAATWSE